MSELKATTAQEIVRIEKDCDYMDELFGGVKMPPTQVYLKSDVDKVLAEKDKELESLNTSHYAEMVDAGMRERRLRRALWLERAKRASAWQIHFALSHNHSIKREFTINGASSPHDRMVTMRTAEEWAMIWKNVERKCRAKAEEFK